MDDVLERVEPLVPRDGPATVPAFRPILMLRAEVLRGLGIIDNEVVRLDLERLDGSDETVEIELIPLAEYTEWAGRFGMYQLPIDSRVRYLADDETFTASLLDDGTAYLRYRFVAPPDLDEVRAWIASDQVDRLVLDLRQNPGGDNNTFSRLLGLVTDFADAHPDATTVLTDRVTFSAAANLATSIEQATDARFVGEPMGGGLNFWDDVHWVRLDALPVPMQVAVSYRHWVFATPDDPRLTIEPDITIEVTAADYFGGRDSALEVALSRED